MRPDAQAFKAFQSAGGDGGRGRVRPTDDKRTGSVIDIACWLGGVATGAMRQAHGSGLLNNDCCAVAQYLCRRTLADDL